MAASTTRPLGDERRPVAPALAWIEEHLDDRGAYRALRGLLDRHDLDEGACARLATAALAWIGFHADEDGVRVILCDLLARYDLDDAGTESVVATALEWLDRRGGEEESDFVIRALLSRGDLEGEPAARARGAALAWLGLHGTTPEAQFTLRALLRREELDGAEARRAVEAALAWLDLHREREEASFVLPLLLGRSGLRKGEGPRVVLGACAWLERHGARVDADFVLRALVRSRHVSPDTQHRAGEHVLAWLRGLPPERAARRYGLLLDLLHHAPRFDDAILRGAVDDAIRGLPGADLPAEMHSDLLFELNRVARRVDRVAAVRALAASAPPGLAVPKAPRAEMKRLADEVLARARETAAPVDVAWLRRAMLEMGRQVDQHAAVMAVPAVAGMLPLAARTGSAPLADEAAALAADVLREARLEPQQLAGALRACRQLLDAWPDRAAGEQVLAALEASLPGGRPRDAGPEMA